jgi:hypothetical protein
VKRSNYRMLFFAVLILAVFAARIGFTPPAQVSPAAVAPLQEDTPIPPGEGEGSGLPATGGETTDQVGERHAEQLNRGGNWPFLILLGIAFIAVVIGLLTRARSHRFR